MNKPRVVVFLPAYNEEGSIADVIGSIPREAMSARYDVVVLVVDDGSTDGTAERAKLAGADRIVRFPANRGLGAAVRAGLAESVALGADIAVMIDADGEYPASRIPQLITPIAEGKADYVLGSRFLGTIRGMKWNRRAGNYLFTWMQRLMLGLPITDGQSGMRAFSREAALDAEIIHDYNYAQVLTINLVGKGFRLTEVPIPYRTRTTGQSFVTFRKYVGSVLPAMYREWRRSSPGKRAGRSVPAREGNG